MSELDLSSLEIFCLGETCGDPVPSFDGVPRYTKRRMIYTGKGWFADAVDMCPVCGSKRKFAYNKLSSGFHEVGSGLSAV